MVALRKPKHHAAKVSESTLVSGILKALTLKGYFCWRNNSGLTVLSAQGGAARRVVKGAPAGSPDILLVLPTDSYWMQSDTRQASDGTSISSFSSVPARLGVLHGLEVKTATGKLQASQISWHANAAKHGVRTAVVRTIGEALACVETWQTGKLALVREGKAVGK